MCVFCEYLLSLLAAVSCPVKSRDIRKMLNTDALEDMSLFDMISLSLSLNHQNDSDKTHELVCGNEKMGQNASLRTGSSV